MFCGQGYDAAWVANAAFTAILDNQRKYGFKDVTSYGTAEGIFWEYVVLYLEFVSTERTCGSLAVVGTLIVLRLSISYSPFESDRRCVVILLYL